MTIARTSRPRRPQSGKEQTLDERDEAARQGEAPREGMTGPGAAILRIG